MFVYDFVYKMVANYLFDTIWASYADASGTITGMNNMFACMIKIRSEQAYWCPVIATTVTFVVVLIVVVLVASIIRSIVGNDAKLDEEEV